MASLALNRFAPLLGRRLPVRGPARLMFASYAKSSPPPGASVRHLTTKSGDRFDADLSSFLEWSLWAFGGYEQHLAELFGLLVRPGNRCIDVGANVGIHTIRLAKLAGPAGEVIAIEADPDIVRRARYNIGLNGLGNVRLLHAAASARGGDPVLLHRPADRDPNKGRASLLPLPYLTGPAARLHTVAIDDLTAGPVALIKIDVEGHEMAVMLGAKRTIEEHTPAVIFEWAPELLTAATRTPFGWLAGRGYQLFDIRADRSLLTGRARLRLAHVTRPPGTGTNILAVPPRLAARAGHLTG